MKEQTGKKIMQETETFDHASRVDEPLISELQEYGRQLEEVNSDARDLIAGLADRQSNWRPAPGHWSIAECLDHLTITGRISVSQIREAIKDAHARQLYSPGPFSYGRLGQLLVRSMGPQPRMKFKAPKIFKPPRDRPLVEVEHEFFALQDDLLDCIRESNGINLKRARVASPVSKLLKLSLGQEYALLLAHERRHLWQARQVKDNPAFPFVESD